MQNHAKKYAQSLMNTSYFREPWVTIATAASTINTLNVSFNR